MINVSADFSGMAHYIGVIKGVAKQSHSYVDTLITNATDTAEREFGIATDAAAASGSTLSLDHVYEPGQRGVTSARLWLLTKGGHAGSRAGSRDIGFRFLPSKVRPENTPESTGIPASIFPEGLRERSRVPFFNRAIVLELGQQVTIAPKYVENIFVPNWELNPSGKNKVSATSANPFVFLDRPTTFRPEKYMGNFSSFWNLWWEQNADRIVEQSGNEIENAVPQVISKASRTHSKYRRNRNISMYVKEGERESMIAGEQMLNNIRRGDIL